MWLEHVESDPSACHVSSGWSSQHTIPSASWKSIAWSSHARCRACLDRHQHLDAAVEVTRHEVRRTDQIDLVTLRAGQPTVHDNVAVLEAVDATVLEVAPENAADTDVLAHSGDSGAQTADAAHEKFDANAGLTRGIERFDHLFVRDRVALHHDLALGSEAGFVLDQVEELATEVARRNEQRRVVVCAAIAGEVVEQLGCIGTDVGIAGDDSDVFVNARGLAVVVPVPMWT